MGSPPLARGTAPRSQLCESPSGITPACAGNSHTARYHAKFSGDHPRLRGEQLTAPPRWAKRLGSPPLARGTGGTITFDSAAARITPACAGNRCSCFSSALCSRDHPRLRGEQARAISFPSWPIGSPPLARGTAPALARLVRHGRITPACAGNRCPYPARRGKSRDHPRLRGEQLAHRAALLPF